MLDKQLTSPVDIELTLEFEQAFDILENSEDNLFITGKAGTGKSTFLDYFRKNTAKQVVVVAPTGVAALNVGGQTIHSFFQFKPRFLDPNTITSRKRNQKLYNKIDVLIIDEISMVRADIFDGIEKFLRLNGKKKGKPFGGVQICVIGDLYQLPPIVSYDEQEIFHQFYQSPFFFSSNSYKEARFKVVELEHVFRQSEQDFIHTLNKIRIGDTSLETLNFINQRHMPVHTLEGELPVTLTATNAVADRINMQKLAELRSEEFTYAGTLHGSFVVQNDKLPAPEQLRLRIGAQVMLTKNDLAKRWVNGTIGVISNLSPEGIEVAIKSGGKTRIYAIKKEEWESVRYNYDEGVGVITEEVMGTYSQYPLILAWAVTIHKSQGKTLDSVIINLGSGAFAPGQLYVALSRCRSFNRIILHNKITQRDIRCDAQVVAFTKDLKSEETQGWFGF